MTAQQDVLTVHLDAHPWALPLEAVLDVCRSLPVAPLPGAPNHILGLAAWRGRVIPCIGLRQLCAVGGQTVPRQCLMVVVRLRGGEVGLEVEGPVAVLAASTAGDASGAAAPADRTSTRLPPVLDLERVVPRYDTDVLAGDAPTTGA